MNSPTPYISSVTGPLRDHVVRLTSGVYVSVPIHRHRIGSVYTGKIPLPHAFVIKLLNSMVIYISHINVVVRVDGYFPSIVKFSVPSTVPAEGFQ